MKKNNLFIVPHNTKKKRPEVPEKSEKRNCHVISTWSGTLLRRSLLGTDGAWTPPSFPREKVRAFPTVPDEHLKQFIRILANSMCEAILDDDGSKGFQWDSNPGFELAIPKRYICAQGSP